MILKKCFLDKRRDFVHTALIGLVTTTPFLILFVMTFIIGNITTKEGYHKQIFWFIHICSWKWIPSAHADKNEVVSKSRNLQQQQQVSRNTGTTASVPTTIFYAIGDTPYSDNDAIRLKTQVMAIPQDAEFVIHVGDLLQNKSCPKELYKRAASILKLSPVPVFVILGDNDWNDCKNPDQAFQYWKEDFLNFDARHWNASKAAQNPKLAGVLITRQLNRTENFSFVHKGTLFIGLNLVNGIVLNSIEWSIRLTEQFNWTIHLIQQYIRRLHRATNSTATVGRIILFGHTEITNKHDAFFVPLRNYVRDVLKNTIPILYLHGDVHRWVYQPSMFNQSSMLRVALEGMTKAAPVKVMVHATGLRSTPDASFIFDRRL